MRLRGNRRRSICRATAFRMPIPERPQTLPPHTRFDSAGNVIGGFGVENVITDNSHSTYHALQTSLSGTVGHGGPGIQASYTWSKSIDDTSLVLGGTGSTGAVASGFSQNPFDTHAGKGPFEFRCYARLRLERGAGPASGEREFSATPISQKVITDGWEMLSISSISSGSPFTVYSGIQQTGCGVERRGSSRSDCEAASLDRAQGPQRLLWSWREQWTGFLHHSRVPSRGDWTEPGTIRHTRSQHVPRSGLL